MEDLSRSYMNPERLGVMFYCPVGWEPLLKEFVLSVDEMMVQDDNPIGLSPWRDFQVVQVKQKWGRLTIYYEKAPEHRKQEIGKLVFRLGDASESMCEECGKVFEKTHCNERCSVECEDLRLKRRRERLRDHSWKGHKRRED